MHATPIIDPKIQSMISHVAQSSIETKVAYLHSQTPQDTDNKPINANAAINRHLERSIALLFQGIDTPFL